jgi:hypothetical protein
MVSFNVAAFVLGQDFVTGEDGRLHASNLEAIRSCVIRSDLADNKNDLPNLDTI